MKTVKLGKSGLKSAPIIFGGNVFGWTLDEKKIVQDARRAF